MVLLVILRHAVAEEPVLSFEGISRKCLGLKRCWYGISRGTGLSGRGIGRSARREHLGGGIAEDPSAKNRPQDDRLENDEAKTLATEATALLSRRWAPPITGPPATAGGSVKIG